MYTHGELNTLKFVLLMDDIDITVGGRFIVVGNTLCGTCSMQGTI